MIRAVARVAVWWCFWHAAPAPPVDVEPFRIVGPAPSLIEAEDPHIGLHYHSDDPQDQAITIQVTSWRITL